MLTSRTKKYVLVLVVILNALFVWHSMFLDGEQQDPLGNATTNFSIQRLVDLLTDSNSNNSYVNVEASKIVPETNTTNWPFMFSEGNRTLPNCPDNPPNLHGKRRVWSDFPPLSNLTKLYPDLEPGGHGRPKDCLANHRVAIIVPYRDREPHLLALLHNLHYVLKIQQLDYAIFIVEQIKNQTFNRGKLMNVGFAEASKLYDFQCFIFHDVDLIPENDRNLYSCPRSPRHMSVAIDKFQYKLPYGTIFGGVGALTQQQFTDLNGFPNVYWGWGGEDDDMSHRIKLAGLNISRYPADIARYVMIKHTQEKLNSINPCRHKILSKTKYFWRDDGINNLNYKIADTEYSPLYTRFLVDLLEKESKLAQNEMLHIKC